VTTWADLRVGDVIAPRAGPPWRVEAWEAMPTTRWLAAGGGGGERVFTLSITDGSRPPITAPHNLSDPVDRVFQYDGQDHEALTALGAAFKLTMIGEALMTVDPQAPCTHPADELSTLASGQILCTGCFTKIGQTDPPAPVPAPVAPAPVEVPPYAALDSSGVAYTIPAHDRRSACDAGIHPVSALGEATRHPGTDMWARPCSACGLVMALSAGYVTELGLDEPVTLDVLDPLPPAPVDLQPLNPWDPARDKTALPLVPAQPAQTAAAPSDAPPEPTVAPAPAVPVAVTTDRPAAPVDVFADPAPTVEVKRDRWGRYLLPDPYTGIEQGWTRASTLARCLADEYNLTGWKMRMVALGIAHSADLRAGIIALKDINEGEDKKTARTIVSKAMERAESSAGATLGTALHNFTHRLDRGEPLASLRAPEPLGADLAEYQTMLGRHGLSIVPGLIERIVVCPRLGAAGTFDRIFAQRPTPGSNKPLTVGDLKTGKSVEWSWLEWAIQLSIYANATHMWDVAAQAYVEMPPPDVLDRDRALVLHLPVGKATGTVYGVNLIEGWEAAQVAEQVRQYRNSSRGYGWLVNPVDPTALLLHRVSQADGPELSRLWERHYPAGEWTDAVASAAEARVARLGAVPV
jgi:hypothetical protein